MPTSLVFTKENNGKYRAIFQTEGYSTIQVCRKAPGMLLVSAYLGSLRPVPIGKYPADSTKDVIFELPLQSGINVMIESDSEVESASFVTDVAD